jgi:DNA-binding transcriptional ArsR family regulator
LTQAQWRNKYRNEPAIAKLTACLRPVVAGHDRLIISLKSVISLPMILEQLKALGNDTRMQMMQWLKAPLTHFPPQDHGDPAIGVCVTHLQHKARLSPSTASAHLAILQRAGFVLTTRIGKWTYYRRNEQAIADFAARLKIEL